MICVLGLATIIHVNAQRETNPDRSPEKQAERITERMTERLNLDENQQKEIYALHLEQAEMRKAEMEKRRQAMTEARKAYQERIAAVLTPEQRDQWEASQKEARERMQRHRSDRQRDKSHMERGRGGNRPSVKE